MKIEVLEIPDYRAPSLPLFPGPGFYYHRGTGTLYHIGPTNAFVTVIVVGPLVDAEVAPLDPYKLLAVALHASVAERVV